ncbi:hypothetical protein [Pseudomonas sp. C2B4]|uniref:hypothetical protein n=1 Tax=Pseudomonas sp. C2B4 TaxID=2735270 RepID=UPI001585DE6D|nr:hypothetical protein [Pseudomonas sp. C2B4]NUU37359.1 hypothetical protein [Pseudomonas sp. C2B4]
MQNELRKAIRFDDFWAVYGPEGVVALAWWIGAQHANELRANQNSYPFLEITAPAGSGSSVLLSYLSKLIGKENYRCCSPEHATKTARLRNLEQTGTDSIVYQDQPESAAPFDWDEIKTLYNGGSASYGTREETREVTFKGTLIISANQPVKCSDAVRSRMIDVRLKGRNFLDKPPHIEAMHQLTVEEASVFGQTIQEKKEHLLFTVNKLVPVYVDALTQGLNFIRDLDPRGLHNCAQVMALVNVLSDLLGLANEHRAAPLEVLQTIASEYAPY